MSSNVKLSQGTWICIQEPFAGTFFDFLFNLGKFEIGTNSDWLYGLANQRFCQLQMFLNIEKNKTKNVPMKS